MSGGSYNYLHELNHGLEGQRSDIEAMRDRLLAMSEGDHTELPQAAAAQAAAATQNVLDLLNQARTHAQTLRGVWHAVEWRDSGDYGDNQVAEALTAYQEQHATPKAPAPQGADIEILDRSTGSPRVILPTAVRVNGRETLIPQDAVIRISDIRQDELPTITLTMFVGSLTIARDPA
jgi:hypothetical protein